MNNLNTSINNSPSLNIGDFPVWTALITPLLEDDSIDFEALKSVAINQARANNAILLLGSTGEGLALSEEEQFAIVETICDLNLQVPIMVAVGGYNLAAQKQWIERCNKLPIHSYLLGTPIYAKPGPVGQTQWFKALLDAAKYPCMLYNVPSRSAVEIPFATIRTLQDHPNCWSLKEASGDLNKFLAYREHCPNIELYSGEDAMMPYLVNAGAKGLVSVCANAWPEATNRYVSLSLQGRVEGLFPLWQNAVDMLFQVASPIPVKTLMHLQGQINTPLLRAPLTHLELAANHNLMDFDKQVEQWFQHNGTGKVVGE